MRKPVSLFSANKVGKNSPLWRKKGKFDEHGGQGTYIDGSFSRAEQNWIVESPEPPSWTQYDRLTALVIRRIIGGLFTVTL